MTSEIERRVRTLEEELNGERLVSRYAVEQVGRNSEVLHAVRAEIAAVRADVSAGTTRVDLLAGQMTVVQAALTRHGRALDVLMQDVREIRTEQQHMRTEQQHMRTEQQHMHTSLQDMNSGLQDMRAGLQDMRQVVGAMNRKLDTFIADTPGDPAAG